MGGRALSRGRLRRRDAAGDGLGAARLPPRLASSRRSGSPGASRSTCSCPCSTGATGARCRRCPAARPRRRAGFVPSTTRRRSPRSSSRSPSARRSGARGASSIARPPPAGEPPFADWYHSLVSVPYFDYVGGGIPVALLQLVSSDPALAETAHAEPDDGGAAPAHARGHHRRPPLLAQRRLGTHNRGRMRSE